MVLRASNQVNESIDQMTKRFIEANGLMSGDFDATFIPKGNGCYSLKVWCSNRNERIYQHYDEYSELAHGCLTPHAEALGKAHAAIRE